VGAARPVRVPPSGGNGRQSHSRAPAVADEALGATVPRGPAGPPAVTVVEPDASCTKKIRASGRASQAGATGPTPGGRRGCSCRSRRRTPPPRSCCAYRCRRGRRRSSTDAAGPTCSGCSATARDRSSTR